MTNIDVTVFGPVNFPEKKLTDEKRKELNRIRLEFQRYEQEERVQKSDPETGVTYTAIAIPKLDVEGKQTPLYKKYDKNREPLNSMLRIVDEDSEFLYIRPDQSFTLKNKKKK